MTSGVALAGLLLGAADADEGGAGILALLMIALLGVATVLLVRNMSGRLKRLPRSFDPDREERKRDERRQGRDH